MEYIHNNDIAVLQQDNLTTNWKNEQKTLQRRDNDVYDQNTTHYNVNSSTNTTHASLFPNNTEKDAITR